MSVNHEFQFMAMLEGHELEKELLSVVRDTTFMVGFLQKTCLLAKLGLG